MDRLQPEQVLEPGLVSEQEPAAHQMDPLQPGLAREPGQVPAWAASEPGPDQTDRLPREPERVLVSELVQPVSGQEPGRTDQPQPELAASASGPVLLVSVLVQPVSEQEQTDLLRPEQLASAELALVLAPAWLGLVQQAWAGLVQPAWAGRALVQQASPERVRLALRERVQPVSAGPVRELVQQVSGPARLAWPGRVLRASPEQAQRASPGRVQPALVPAGPLVQRASPAVPVSHRPDLAVRDVAPWCLGSCSQLAEHSPSPVRPRACRKRAPVRREHSTAGSSDFASDRRGPCSGRTSKSPAKPPWVCTACERAFA